MTPEQKMREPQKVAYGRVEVASPEYARECEEALGAIEREVYNRTKRRSLADVVDLAQFRARRGIPAPEMATRLTGPDGHAPANICTQLRTNDRKRVSRAPVKHQATTRAQRESVCGQRPKSAPPMQGELF